MKTGKDFQTPQGHAAGEGLEKWLALTIAGGVVFVLCAIFYTWLYVQQVQNGYRLAKLYEEHEQQLILQRKLRLEWSRFQDPFELEALGRRRFGLAPPRLDQKVLMR